MVSFVRYLPYVLAEYPQRDCNYQADERGVLADNNRCPLLLITREGGGREATTTRVVVYNRSYSNHKHDYALGRHTPLDSESFTIITRYIGEYQETDYVNSRLDECLFNRVRLEASSNCTVVVRWKLVQVGYSLEGLEKGWEIAFCLTNSCC